MKVKIKNISFLDKHVWYTGKIFEVIDETDKLYIVDTPLYFNSIPKEFCDIVNDNEKSIPRYAVIEDGDLERFVNTINEKLNEGWKLHGDTIIRLENPTIYFQAFTKET